MIQPKALQFDAELNAFIEILMSEKVRSYLEIGSKFGGSLWRIANALPKDARIVSVDMPWGDRSTIPHLQACIAAIKESGRAASLLLGDSTDERIVEDARKLGPFDCVLIDANHTLPYVTRDWENYGPMASIVAFHDIAWRRPLEWKGGYRIDVPQLWESIKGGYRHREIKLDPTGQDNGFGVLWRTTI